MDFEQGHGIAVSLGGATIFNKSYKIEDCSKTFLNWYYVVDVESGNLYQTFTVFDSLRSC